MTRRLSNGHFRRGNGALAKGRGRGGFKPPALMERPMFPPPCGPDGFPFPEGMGPRFGPPPFMPPPGSFDFMGRGSRPNIGFRGFGGPPNRMMRAPLGGRGAKRGRGALLPHPPPLFPPHRPMLHPFSPMGPFPGRGMPRPGWRGFPFPRGSMAARGRQNKKIINKKNGNGSPEELNKPWVTESMKNDILKKRKLYQKAKKSQAKEDWEAFKEHRNKVTKVLREAKLEYQKEHPEASEGVSENATPGSADSEEKGQAPAETPEETPMNEEGGANEQSLSDDPEIPLNDPVNEDPPLGDQSDLLDSS